LLDAAALHDSGFAVAPLKGIIEPDFVFFEKVLCRVSEYD
jgi:hypothetical protein